MEKKCKKASHSREGVCKCVCVCVVGMCVCVCVRAGGGGLWCVCTWLSSGHGAFNDQS